VRHVGHLPRIQNHLPSSLIIGSIDIRVHDCLFVGCENDSCPKSHSLKVFANRVLRRIFVPERAVVTGDGVNCTVRSCVICGRQQM